MDLCNGFSDWLEAVVPKVLVFCGGRGHQRYSSFAITVAGELEQLQAERWVPSQSARAQAKIHDALVVGHIVGREVKFAGPGRASTTPGQTLKQPR